ncbi:MAG: hypothetical protein M1837_002721 [Sclerophora amabilis]|nr:MAG: hypothetical protein M1837_002721 [Sclerophora amabilis]
MPINIDNLFTSGVAAPFEDRAITLPSHSIHSEEELKSIQKQIQHQNFNVNAFPKLRIAKSGTPYYQTMFAPAIDDGIEEDGSQRFLKVLTIDVEDWKELGEGRIVEMLETLANHVRGRQDISPPTGFLPLRPHLNPNRDGKDTAFTTGITLFNSFLVFPTTHSASCTAKDPAVPDWMQQFHCQLGNVAAAVMDRTMGKEYQDFCRQRQASLNTPCFGKDPYTQPYFTSSQINCSTASQHVEGTAGSVHADILDCPASYSMSVNLSVTRPTTSLRFFWFPNLDLMIPLHPLQIIIFQGIKEHSGMPIEIESSDNSLLPYGYMEDVRYNIICYPKRQIINDKAGRAMDGSFPNVPSRPTLNNDALPHFGGEDNYQWWRMVEAGKTALEILKRKSETLEFKASLPAVMQSLKLPSERFQPALDHLQRHYHDPEMIWSRVALVQHLIQQNVVRPMSTLHSTSNTESQLEPLMDPIESLHPTPVQTFSQIIDGLEISEESNIDPTLLEQDPNVEEAGEPETNDTITASTILTSFQERLSQLFDRTTLEAELNAWETPKLNALSDMNKGMLSVSSMLPVANSLDSLQLHHTVEACLAYGHVIGYCLQKSDQALFIHRILHGSFMKLVSEMLTLFRTDRLNMWEDLSDSRLPLANPSLGLQLYREVDAIFTQWEDGTRTEQQYVVCAEDLLGSHYNSLIHLDVELVFPPIFHRQHLSMKKTNVLLQILWGLFLHRPLVAFQNFYVDRKQAMPSRYIDRLASPKNKVRGKVLSRLSLFNELVDILATTVPETPFLRDGLLLLDQIYELAFGHLPMQKLKIETRHALVDHF